jgi:hypothetical protein
MLKAIRHDRKGNTAKFALLGLAIGFGMNGLCILISALHGDIKLYFGGFNLVNLLIFFLFVGIQSSSEEVLMRVFLYQKLRRRYRHPGVAIIVNALTFALLHAANPGFTAVAMLQIFVVAILFSFFIYYYGSFWAAAAIHTGWNFTQSILFGLPNSGIVSAYSLFRLDAASARDGLFYNVNFGVEGSIGSSIVIGIVTVVVFVLGRKQPWREDLWKDEEAAADAAMALSDAAGSAAAPAPAAVATDSTPAEASDN